MRLWLAAVMAASLLTLAAHPATAASDYVIGFETSVTGPYISNSLTNQVAVDIAVEEINAKGGVNGHKLKVVQFDTGGDPKQAQVGLRQLDDRGALAVIGPFASAECRVTFEAGERLGIPAITNGASAPDITKGYKFAFRDTSDEFTQFRRLVTAMKAKKLPIATASIVYATDEFISKTLGEQLYPAVFKAENVTVPATVGFPLAAFDLSTQVGQLKEHPSDAVAVGATTDATIKLAHEMRRQGIKSRIIGSGVIADSTLPEKIGADGDGLLFPTYYFPSVNAQTERFAATFAAASKQRGFQKLVPNHNDASAYDSVYILAEAMRRGKVGGEGATLAADRTAIRAQLADMRAWHYRGILGDNYFGPDGAAHMPTYIIVDERGRLRLFATENE